MGITDRPVTAAVSCATRYVVAPEGFPATYLYNTYSHTFDTSMSLMPQALSTLCARSLLQVGDFGLGTFIEQNALPAAINVREHYGCNALLVHIGMPFTYISRIDASWLLYV